MTGDVRNPDARRQPGAAPAKGDAWEQIMHSSWSQAVRWLAAVALVIGNWAITARPGALAAWLPVIIISVVLVVPDVHSIAFGGVELELRRTKEEVAELRHEVTMLQAVTTNVFPVDVAAAIKAVGELREQVGARR
jgi:hypothetical protein